MGDLLALRARARFVVIPPAEPLVSAEGRLLAATELVEVAGDHLNDGFSPQSGLQLIACQALFHIANEAGYEVAAKTAERIASQIRNSWRVIEICDAVLGQPEPPGPAA